MFQKVVSLMKLNKIARLDWQYNFPPWRRFEEAGLERMESLNQPKVVLGARPVRAQAATAHLGNL